MKMFMAVFILGCVASSRAIFFDLFKKESWQADPWVQQPADPWVQQPADPWVQQPADPWVQQPPVQQPVKEIPIFKPYLEFKPISIPFPKLEPVPVVKPFPILKPEFVEAQVPLYKPQVPLPNKYFNFNANVGLHKQPQQYQQAQYHQAQHQQHHQQHLPTAYQAPDAHHH
ncbi:alpha/beta-gliadin A-III-like [Penaeus monodon]|uniref:alpha/beta-gliadin A-III-like n=1 Tax=Penaeus monodon TaxID=6687 RepID=UPI0018A7AEF8|nr:alpha/beta-gliadin A-III-like [Penaeus monodon]